MDEPFGSINEVIHSEFLGFFENKDIVEYISDRSGIGEVTAKTLFNQGRSKGSSSASTRLDMNSVSLG